MDFQMDVKKSEEAEEEIKTSHQGFQNPVHKKIVEKIEEDLNDPNDVLVVKRVPLKNPAGFGGLIRYHFDEEFVVSRELVEYDDMSKPGPKTHIYDLVIGFSEEE